MESFSFDILDKTSIKILYSNLIRKEVCKKSLYFLGNVAE